MSEHLFAEPVRLWEPTPPVAPVVAEARETPENREKCADPTDAPENVQAARLGHVAAMGTQNRRGLKSPYPYFGGKSRIAPTIWQRLGNVPNYCEPFFGSGAVLLSRPHAPKTETVNDLDGMIANFWRALQAAPEAVAYHADNPVNENDLHARHVWLVNRKASMQAQLEGDPDWFDAKAAGWWVWGISCWIGSGWCSGEGPWGVVGGRFVHLGNAGQGVNRKLPHLGNAGRGVNRQLPHLGDAGQRDSVRGYLRALRVRMENVRVTCGDWTRVCGPSVTFKHGLTGIVLDPPYSHEERTGGVYAEDNDVAADVRKWAVENGSNPLLRIALCGYAEEHDAHVPASWERLPWHTKGGYDGQAVNGSRAQENRRREMIWFSPACLRPTLDLFAPAADATAPETVGAASGEETQENG